MIIFPTNSDFGYTTALYSPQLLANYPDFTFVFGDNLQRKGLSGQAIVRNCTNSYGFITKLAPNMLPSSFLTDSPEHLNLIIKELDKLHRQTALSTIILPAGGLGTGLANLAFYAPNLLATIDNTLSSWLGIDYKSLRS